MFRNIFIVIAFSFSLQSTQAQTGAWPSPEVKQMYLQAKEYLSKGGINQSIVLLQQAIQLAPNVVVLHRDLAHSYNLAGQYKEAYYTIEPIIEKGLADDMGYQIAGEALHKMGESKKARKIYEKGIKANPHSGILYYELGKYYSDNNDPEFALSSWLQGIKGNPTYHLNYYEAAKTYAGSDEPLWAILFGEIFINIEKETPRSMDARRIVMNAYAKLFNTIGTGYVPKYGKKSETAAKETIDFENAVMKIFLKLAPVVSDGITAENLTMLRTRFVMDWMTYYAAQFPYSLFTYQEKIIREGQFDAYNQWLFGETENKVLFESWKKFNPEAISSLTTWMQQNRFYPTASDYYYDNEIGHLFSKRK